ncbi:uncharacterized protein DSM5745_07690 [Aspergillus mulundensis]|uniref:Uncharacterized protein n=1 Tax=Aspergillus mulundensis TaxID=1810919 RepID=A0A3D8RF08_9EURO|nr:hypothetical protein DSM5745_07690 [Aspergillus mulundensis]RDW72518.1 hypothetical protein DSM5745_07690 [Aspergillus mulundensis]
MLGSLPGLGHTSQNKEVNQTQTLYQTIYITLNYFLASPLLQPTCPILRLASTSGRTLHLSTSTNYLHLAPNKHKSHNSEIVPEDAKTRCVSGTRATAHQRLAGKPPDRTTTRTTATPATRNRRKTSTDLVIAMGMAGMVEADMVTAITVITAGMEGVEEEEMEGEGEADVRSGFEVMS